ncbi:PQQ-binding-like beta-propeller repeat protein [Dactylosporangium sp. NPDC051485]|uniref:outer membrane protein assembly factor BamB family protein n=1 Tax=Dactylosporangium sp. NPDC051485 TaxID=3154846 RepID=UPI00343B9F64
MRRPLATAGLLVVPAAVLTASVAAHPEPAPAPPAGPAAAEHAPRPGDLERGAAFGVSLPVVVGYDPAADVLVTQPQAGTELAGLDAHTGAQRWRRALEAGGALGTVLWAQSDLGGGSVLVNTFHKGTKAGELTALSTRSGEVRWRMPLSTRTTAMAAGPAVLVAEPAQAASPMRWAADTSEKPAPRAGRPDRMVFGPRAAPPRAQPGRARLGAGDDGAEAAARTTPTPGTINALAAGNGGRLWSAELPEGCDLRAAAGDGRTVAMRLACADGDRLELREARGGKLRAGAALDPEADDGGLGLLVRDGATLVRGTRTFSVFGPDGKRLVERSGDGCAEFCDLAVEGGVAVVAQSGGATDHTDGALEAFALADGEQRWRAELTVRALVRAGGRLYAVGPAPAPVPFMVVSGVSEDGPSASYATAVPATATAQPGSALLVRDGGELAWYRIRPVDRPAGYLGGAAQRPDPCQVLPPADLRERFAGQPVTAQREGDATCTLSSPRTTLRVDVLWAGTDEAQAIQRYHMMGNTGAKRYGTVVVALTARKSSSMRP